MRPHNALPSNSAATIQLVKRALIIMMLFLLPLQLVWAGAATYCEHHAEAHQPHFGHHDGHHHATVGDAQSDGDAASVGAAADVDASHCHGTCAALLTVRLQVPTFTATQPATGCADPGQSAPVLSRPERPQWTLHA